METPFPFRIRPLTSLDEPFLWECLYLALYVPPQAPPPSRDLLKDPDLSKYVKGWGRPGDWGFLAFDPSGPKNLGALWLRSFTHDDSGYGYVSDLIPELSLAVVRECRGEGIGSSLLERLFSEEKYPAISLSVSPQNPALRLYARFGFEQVGTKGDSLTMLWRKGSA